MKQKTPHSDSFQRSKMTEFTVVIPARFDSSRFPGKPLADIAGKPMVQHVYEKALASDASKVIIATDDERIMKVAKNFGADVCMTLCGHPSGTDRLQEVAVNYGLKNDEIVVNVQGDEPLIPPSVINQVARNLQRCSKAGMATLSIPLVDVKQMFDPNIVKVVVDVNGYAIYFSRAAIPWARDEFNKQNRYIPDGKCFQRHIGIYAYRVNLLHHYVKWGESPIEKIESLEQLRFIWNDSSVHVAEAVEIPPHGVDTEEDMHDVRKILDSKKRQAAVDLA